jgi:hypothetical protein
MRRFQVRGTHHKSDQGVFIQMWLADAETGERVSDEEVRRCFLELSATGMHVIKRCDARLLLGFDGYPVTGVVDEVDGDQVILAGLADRVSIPRQLFHQLYRLD